MYPVIRIFKVDLDSYTLFYLSALIIAALLLKHELKRNKYPRYIYIELIAVGLITGIIGSKTYYLLENWDESIQNPVETLLSISGSGWYGGLILGAILMSIAIRITRLPVLRTLDILSPIVILAQTIGRIGCFFAGCCHGIPSDLPWAVSFQNGLFPSSVKVHPTQLYEMSFYLLIFIFLWSRRNRVTSYGIITGLYLILSGIARFVIEYFRINPKILYGLTTPQLIALLGIIIGTVIIVALNKKRCNDEGYKY